MKIFINVNFGEKYLQLFYGFVVIDLYLFICFYCGKWGIFWVEELRCGRKKLEKYFY